MSALRVDGRLHGQMREHGVGAGRVARPAPRRRRQPVVQQRHAEQVAAGDHAISSYQNNNNNRLCATHCWTETV